MMNFKKIWLLSAFAFSAVMLTGCGKAPNLSFEETLKVYSAQSKIIKDAVTFMNDKEHQLQSNTKVKIGFWKKESLKGSSTIERESISENKTQNTESTASIHFDMEPISETTGGLSKVVADLKLNTLLKDYQIFFKIADFKLETEPKETAGMLSTMADAFKEKWLTVNLPEMKEVLQTSAQNSFSFWQNEKLYEANTNYYTGVSSTTYDGNPAWKVDFNTEEIQKIALEMYDLSLSGDRALNSGDQELLAKQQQMRDEFQQLLSGMKFENTEAYFVIRSAKKVDFIIKNADFSFGEMKMKISQLVDGDKIISDFLILWASSEENVKVKLVLDKARKGNIEIKLSAERETDKKSEKLFELSGRIKAMLTDTILSLQPQFDLKADELEGRFEADFVAKKIDHHVFTSPKDAQDIQEVLGSFFGAWGTEDIPTLSGEVTVGTGK